MTYLGDFNMLANFVLLLLMLLSIMINWATEFISTSLDLENRERNINSKPLT